MVEGASDTRIYLEETLRVRCAIQYFRALLFLSLSRACTPIINFCFSKEALSSLRRPIVSQNSAKRERLNFSLLKRFARVVPRFFFFFFAQKERRVNIVVCV